MFERFFVLVIILLFDFLSGPGKAMAQDKTILAFSAKWENIVLSKSAVITDSATGKMYRFTKIKQYVSGVTFLKSGRVLWLDTTYHLIDFMDDSKNILVLNHHIVDFDEIQFLTGVDSAMQIRGVQAGALDPLHGMYWTWQSGYIHTKIEAEIEQNGNVRPLELHLGGYRYPHSTIQRVAVKSADQQHAQILFNLKPLVEFCEEKQWCRVMSPGNNACILSKVWAGQIPEKP